MSRWEDRPARRGAARGDEGAALIEFALALPLLAMLLMGLIEFGFVYKRSANLESIVGTANRVAVQLGRDRTADAEALRSVAAGLSNESGLSIQRVVIWKANSATVGPLCVTGASVSGRCNVYTGAQATSLTGGFTGTDSCSSGAWDAAWCPTTRVDDDLNQDYVGVYVEVRYPSLTKVSTADITIKAWNVMRIEPPLGMDP